MCDCPTPEACDSFVRSDRAYRRRLIREGKIYPLQARPTLRMTRDDRVRAENEALRNAPDAYTIVPLKWITINIVVPGAKAWDEGLDAIARLGGLS